MGQGAGGQRDAPRGRSKVGSPANSVRIEGGTFEKLEVWQEAIDLCVDVYRVFEPCRDYEFRNQVRAAAASVSNNIAEGYERDSNADLIRFLFIAKGSCGEVRSQAHLGCRLQLISEADATRLAASTAKLSKRLQALINVRRTRFA